MTMTTCHSNQAGGWSNPPSISSIHIDLETYSETDLAKCGVYKYAEDPAFEILLFAYSVNEGPIQIVDLVNGETIPKPIIEALSNPKIQKWAFNAQFERICLSRFLGIQYLSPEGWYCSRIWCATLALPLSLKGAGAVLGIEKQKMEEGKNLIRKFCVLKNGKRNLPKDHPQDWSVFKKYNIRDVETEMEIQQRLKNYPVPPLLWKEYWLDQQINDRGIQVDLQLANSAINIDSIIHNQLMQQIQNYTQLENPNSVVQLKSWLADNDMPMDSLGKKEVTAAIESAPETVAEVLKLRLQLAKSSVKKYHAMVNSACKDGRVRGMFKFYGASRTGRFASTIVQMQNLKQNHLPDLAEARSLVKDQNQEALQVLYDDIPDTLSQLIRTAFIPAQGKKFIVADFSAIEARVLSWLAKEKWRQKVFAEGGDIYCASASSMFHVPVEKHGINGHLRQKGKQAELACIAKGQMVPTPFKAKPIESITCNDQVWDGRKWVWHDGLIHRGFKPVIEYGGLIATPDHEVFPHGFDSSIPFAMTALLRIPLTELQNDFTVRFSMADTYDLLNCGEDHRFQVGEVLVHNCGYGGSVGAMKAMGALDYGLEENERQPIVTAWRKANPNIVKLWWDVDHCVKRTITDHLPTSTHGIRFCYQEHFLFIELPSKRRLAYANPRIGKNKFGGESITYMGVGTTKKWERIESYGPKFVENITQAIARDLLVYSMQNLSNERIVAHVHDEIILECDQDQSVDVICQRMAQTPDWAKGLLLRADGYECPFYQKD